MPSVGERNKSGRPKKEIRFDSFHEFGVDCFVVSHCERNEVKRGNLIIITQRLLGRRTSSS